MSDRASDSWLQDGPTAATKAEPINCIGSISVITYLKRRKTAAQQQLREKSENMREKQLCRHQGQ